MWAHTLLIHFVAAITIICGEWQNPHGHPDDFQYFKKISLYFLLCFQYKYKYVWSIRADIYKNTNVATVLLLLCDTPGTLFSPTLLAGHIQSDLGLSMLFDARLKPAYSPARVNRALV